MVVYATEDMFYVSNEHLCKKYPKFFTEEVRRQEDAYLILRELVIDLVKHTYKQMPYKETLDYMVWQSIITQVTTPTPRISSILLLPKKKGILCFYLDTKGLNKAILPKHYPVNSPTVQK